MDAIDNIQAFNKLFADHQGPFTRFAYSYVKDRAVAEDFILEAFMYYWENRHSLKPGSNIPAYILTVVKHKCLNYLQHVYVHERVTEELRDHAAWKLRTSISTLEAYDPEELFSKEAMEIVRKTLDSMPDRTRKIFLMSRFQNKTYKEIAIQLNLTVKGVEFHISKILKELRKNLKDYLPLFNYFFLFS